MQQIKITEKLINMKVPDDIVPLAKILSPAAGKKCYNYYVYKGNYPQQIEDALLKRGVWKRFDREHCARKKLNNQSNKALLNSATPNLRKRGVDYSKNNNVICTSLTVGQTMQL